jgi:hypothetical protein
MCERGTVRVTLELHRRRVYNFAMTPRSSLLILVAMLSPLSTHLSAQWLKLPDKGIPRTKDGKPDLTAPAPRKADGKPDLGGIWLVPGPKYLEDIAADLKPGDLPIQPWAAALTKERMTGAHSGEESDANCLPQGVPKINVAPLPFKIIQNPDEVIVLYEAFGQFRQIFLDGRQLPKDPNPTWLGYSVGKWDRDALVVESSGFNGRTWLDQAGHPATEALRVTERFTRPDFGHLKIEVTINDPKAYTRPWTVTEGMQLLADTDLLEFVCNENNRDLPHLVSK